MSKKCEYVKKIVVKEYKKIMEETIPKVKKDVKEEYGKGFNYQIVGSAKRNLVVQKGDSHWDVDYQFLFLANVFQETSAPELKIFVKDSFKKHLGEKYSIKLSTSVITICLLSDVGKHAIKSFDVALLKNNETTGNKEILRGKTNDNTSSNHIKWEELGGSKESYDNRAKIKGIEMWKTLREIFLEKKCENIDKSKDDQKETFSLYLESINETLDKFDTDSEL